jgi:hypothetical protein
MQKLNPWILEGPPQALGVLAIPADDRLEVLGNDHGRVVGQTFQRGLHRVPEAEAADENPRLLPRLHLAASNAGKCALGPMRPRRHQLAAVEVDEQIIAVLMQGEQQPVGRRVAVQLDIRFHVRSAPGGQRIPPGEPAVRCG